MHLAHVTQDSGTGGEALAAEGAFVRTLARVHHVVRAKTAGPVRRVAANVALMRLFPAVRHEVHAKVGALKK